MSNTNKKKQVVKLKINTNPEFKKTKISIDTLCILQVDQFGNPYCIPICQSCPTPSDLLRNKIKANIQYRRDSGEKQRREWKRKSRQEFIQELKQERRVNTLV